MPRDLRIVNMTSGQKVESDKVIKRIGEISYRDFGVFSRIALFDTGKVLITGGLRVVPSSAMTVSIGSGACIQRFPATSDEKPCLSVEDLTVTLDAASGLSRTDMIEAQISSVTDKDDYGEAIVDSETGTITPIAIKRDLKYRLIIQKKISSTTATAGTAAVLTGSISIPGTIDLTLQYLLNLSIGEDGSFQEIDLRGATPEATSKAEICSAINAVAGYTMATISGNYIVLSGNGTGETSRFETKPPFTDAAKDVTMTIFGIASGVTYTGTNEWFKLAEIDVGPSTTVITTGLIRNIDQKSTWASDDSNTKVLSPLFDRISNTYSENTIVERDATGYVYAAGFRSPSKKSLKKKIKPFTMSASSILKKEKVFSYFYKTDKKNLNPKVGVLADGANILISGPDHDALDAQNCIGLLIKFSHEMIERVEKLESEVKRLKCL